MNMPVDVIAVFDSVGKVTPTYVRLEDAKHALITYKIEDISLSKEERYAGLYHLVFDCYIRSGDSKQPLTLSFNVQNHRWLLLS
ncbi:MAG: hypothetical protein K0R05_1450 [Anaerocolumna sp.]|jgi:hypothetical protein|nr:hypothetical protein [Anaerocolumna sp.]